MITALTFLMMHTRAERKVLPYRQPARVAAARSASLKSIRSIVIILKHSVLTNDIHGTFHCRVMYNGMVTGRILPGAGILSDSISDNT